MVTVSGAYIAFLWLPISPEKIVTFAISITLLRWLFPEDRTTLAVLKKIYNKAKNAIKNKRSGSSQLKKKNMNGNDYPESKNMHYEHL